MRKKFTMLLASLFLTLGTSVAQTWLQPTKSTETETYEYYIMNYREQAYFVTTTNGLNGGAQQLGSANSFTTEKAKVKFKLTEDGKLYSTNTTTELILGYTTTGEAANSVQLFAADSNEGYTWKIEAANGGYTLSAGTSSNSWNMHGGKGANIGLYRKTDAGSNWVFVPANEAAEAKAAEAKALYGISTEYYYQIKNVAYSRMLAANAENKATSISAISTEDLNQLWAFEAAEDGTFLLRNAGQGKYLVAATSNNTAWTVAAEGTKFDVDISNFSNKSWTIHASGQDGYGCAHDANWGWDAQVVRWEAVANASQWYLEKTNVSLNALEINFEYSFTYNGVEKFTQSCTGIVGENYPEITVSFPVGVSATKPTGKLAGQNAGQKISVALSVSELPFFKYADSYADIQYWYYLPMHANERYYMSYVAGQESISLGNDQKALPLLSGDNHNAYLWAFVGNPVDGFMVVNKAAGDTYVLSSTTTISNDANTFPLMTVLSNIDTKTQNTCWYPTSSTHGNNGFFLAQKGYPSNRMNVRGNKLAYWTGGADAGSTFQVTTLATAEDIEMAGSLRNDAGKVGYPKNADKLNGLALNQSTKLDVNVAVKAYKTISDIVLPEDGKAYTFMNVMGNKEHTRRYMKYENGKKLSVSTSADDASVFVCRELRTGVYAFVTEDGKILTWVGNDEGKAYKEDDQTDPFGYSSYYATSYDTKADWNEISVEKYGTDEGNFGHLHMYGRRNKSGLSAIIVKHADNRFDQSNNTKYFNENFSSAWILTEVEHTNNDVQNLALARVGAKNTIGNRTFGEGIGKYHYVVGGQNVYAALNVDRIATIDDINAAVATIAINQPAAGFYRIKSMNGNDAEKKGRFLEADATGMKLAKDGSNPDNKYTSVFYVKDNTILSYSCGQYLNSYGAFDAVGAVPTSWVIEENADIVGTYALKYEENAANNGYLSDWLDNLEENPTNGLNDANAAWTLEAVTWLPVPMNKEIGWATYYAPVQLALSNNRVKAYTGTVEGNWLTLTKKDVIPANEGVVLEYQAGAEVEDGCVFLEVKGSGETVEENALKGTLATKAAPTNEGTIYTLQREQKKDENGDIVYGVDGEVEYLNSVVFGIYANKDNSVPNLKGFRAYLPISTANPTESIGIRFEGTTDIEHSEIRNQHSEMIFDLLGRRVEAITKGGIYIVNGKKVVVK